MITTSSPSPTTLAAHHPAASPHFTSRAHYDGFYPPPPRQPTSPVHSSKYSSRRSSTVTSSRRQSAAAATPKSGPELTRPDTPASALQASNSTSSRRTSNPIASRSVESISSAISRTTLASDKVVPKNVLQDNAEEEDTQAQLAAPPSMPSQTTTSATISTVKGSKRTTSDSPISGVSPESVPRSVSDKPLTSITDAPTSKRARPEVPSIKLLPLDYSECDTRDLVILISSMLMELIRYNDTIPLRDGHLTRFHSRAPPTISVIDYLQRLTTHATLSPPILLSMVYYIDRLCALYPAFTISSLTVHRFLITSATVASKGLSDSFWTNKTYARVGGVSLKELALLELEFLWRVEWRIVPKPEVLVDYYRSLVERNDNYKIDLSTIGGEADEALPSKKDKG